MAVVPQLGSTAATAVSPSTTQAYSAIMAAQVLQAIGDALRMAFYMFWEVLWPLTLGFAISGVVQSVVSREAVVRAVGKEVLRGVTLATLLGADRDLALLLHGSGQPLAGPAARLPDRRRARSLGADPLLAGPVLEREPDPGSLLGTLHRPPDLDAELRLLGRQRSPGGRALEW